MSTSTPKNATILTEQKSKSNSPRQNDDDDECILDKHLFEESFERASADLEILCAAYPQEISIFVQPDSSRNCSTEAEERDNDDVLLMNHHHMEHYQIPSWFPLIFTLSLPSSLDDVNITCQQKFGANVTMEFPAGYPTQKPLQVISYRISPSINKEYIEKVVSCVQKAATESSGLYGGGQECGLQCCAAALDCWNECLTRQQEEHENVQNQPVTDDHNSFITEECKHVQRPQDEIHWISADKTLVDRKSVFQAHVCAVHSDEMVKRAVNQLIESSSKIQRATHNMYAYRFVEKTKDGKVLVKHDNYDDGEDAAGSRLAQLLEMRKENGVLVLVSRWYGGIHLGPKRFAHINNVARDLLVECHEKGLLPDTEKV
mmetsp:Transcript_3118/g.5796  ORF Transcript_3118/g.5796 Transcript_3118/m.5796 type:complete len:374 (-) Transcript_3118:348-1469(-)|eukprot:CAMPEP_0176489008 /NCGR_PEP_ID=MMETSP0200_2-20121128/7039_1 /TAXON_ID=947934 /ORGANISM="Chaetoceros sp., Strain GSL56" /LENGTH=373 /DNA_ID=CAMNT_0017886081 /DNA_START=859 /DNA_END=1980 /DNA_ORIENTATION=+